MPEPMNWETLLSTRRLGNADPQPNGEVRSEHQRDADRIIYSSAFRRLQDKTQVFPLAESDYVRTRLTHSLEVSTVGRSLGTLAGKVVRDRNPTLRQEPWEFGAIVSAASLAHDIGNPPFGHSGEEAIREWFMGDGKTYLEVLPNNQKDEFLKFEGNAQGFRLLTRLLHHETRGGLQLTCATLAAFSKYPRSTANSKEDNSEKVSEKKHGYIDADSSNFEVVAETVGLIRRQSGAWCRHPLAFLLEAADDICYHIIDLEDAMRLKQVSFEEGEKHLVPIACSSGKEAFEAHYKTFIDERSKTEYLRARAINHLINASIEVFEAKYDSIMSGECEKSLTSMCKLSSELDSIMKLSRAKIYSSAQVIHVEAAGFEVLRGLLSKFVPVLLSAPKDRKASTKKLYELVPRQYHDKTSHYDKLVAATDFVSGMTDTFALRLFRRLFGMELPRT